MLNASSTKIVHLLHFGVVRFFYLYRQRWSMMPDSYLTTQQEKDLLSLASLSNKGAGDEQLYRFTKNTLGLTSLVFFVVAAASPLPGWWAGCRWPFLPAMAAAFRLSILSPV
jgi:hypothetical protein